MAAVTCFLWLSTFLALFTFSLCENELKLLNDDSFEHLTQAASGATTGDWLVVFSQADHTKCETCQTVEDIFAQLHQKLQHKLNVAKVLSSSKFTLKRFEVTKFPSVSLFHAGHQYFYSGDNYTLESLEKFVEGFKTSVNRKVPVPITVFDVFIEDLMGDVKHIIRLRKNAAVLIYFSGVLFGLLLTSILKGFVDFLLSTFAHEEEKTNDESNEEDDDNEDEEKDEEEKKDD